MDTPSEKLALSATEPTVDAAAAAAAATSRPALLPAFEPFSSSPGLPRPAKRKFEDTLDSEARKSYPTPVPTSSTGIAPSSPPARRTRPGLQRCVSTLSERAPLGDVPTLQLPSNGESKLMGRSSNSSDYQLSSHRNISRVHVRACYQAPSPAYAKGRIEVECLGWNGIKVHCRGDVIELAKGEIYVSDKFDQSILLDVQDTRVMLVWPKDTQREPPSLEPGSPWSATASPSRHAVEFGSSPPMLVPGRPASPISPTAGLNFGATFNSTFRDDDSDALVKVYEDHVSEEDAPHDPTPTPALGTPTPKQPLLSSLKSPLKESQCTVSSDLEELSEHDEENDPVVHSFYDANNIMSRFESFKHASPERKRIPLKKSSLNSPGRSFCAASPAHSPIKNHVINQLAFSRVHSLPLSTIHSNLPAELRGAMMNPSDNENRQVLTSSDLKTILDCIPCVGEISREGKDAAGKLLESEFYYVPEMDADVNRRDTVTQSLGKTSIRAARKQHKQYYWKRPRH